jgi:NAD-dependent dihydropyrimidine dehydrogenase PreA subunit
MSFVITQACIGTKATECEKVCPVDCIHPREDEAGFSEVEQLFIDPKVCINCGACMAVCPVRAVYPDNDPIWAVPQPFRYFIEKNAAFYRMSLEEFHRQYTPGKSRELIQQFLKQQKAAVATDRAG